VLPRAQRITGDEYGLYWSSRTWREIKANYIVNNKNTSNSFIRNDTIYLAMAASSTQDQNILSLLFIAHSLCKIRWEVSLSLEISEPLLKCILIQFMPWWGCCILWEYSSYLQLMVVL
jgi:hypothetical protein